MTTFANLQTRLSRMLRDTASTPTFVAQETADMLNDGIAEVSRIAPKRFIENVTVVADTLSYALTIGTSPEIEVKRVEVWDISVTPNKQVIRLNPGSAEYEHNSQVGWEYWAGALYIPNAVESQLTVGTHQIRVWGYAPYTTVDIASAATSDQGMSNEVEKAVLVYASMLGFDRLVHDRAKFAQYGAANNNSDVSPASLMSDLSQAREEWRQRSRSIAVLREAP